MKAFLIALGVFGAIGFIALLSYFAHIGGGLTVLYPSGGIGIAERDLMINTVWLMLIVAVPVYLLIIIIAWKYRDGSKAKYSPNWENSVMEEFIWWSIPLEIVLVLGALTWTGTHALAPEKPISSMKETEVVQVVALPWKWLFIYPEEGIATVNELALPAGRPVRFEITADAPMNSFWIPDLGGQMYAMTGMATKLNLIAENPGEFTGKSANYSGDGFAGMNFPVHVLSEADYEAWILRVKESPDSLTPELYKLLAAPSEDTSKQYYRAVSMSFADIMHTYMAGMDMKKMPEMKDMDSMDMQHMH